MSDKLQKIKSIKEAFSMQPVEFSVTSQTAYDNLFKNRPDKDEYIKEIKLISIKTHPDDIMWMYAGFNFNGKKLFQYHEKSVNVHFDVEPVV